MIYNLKSLRKQVFGLSLTEANFKNRGFTEGKEAQPRLELVAKTVVNGYNVAVENGLGEDLLAIRSAIEPELVGFFNEGIGMGLYTLNLFSVSGKQPFWDFVKGEGQHHEYMSYIGAGLACGVFRRPFKKFMDKACPMSGCLVLDGIGFYFAMFKTQKTIQGLYVPNSVKENEFYQQRYDNGIGRAVWFIDSGEPESIAKTINSFPEERRAEIWSGIGLAATYAGGVNADKILLLRHLAGEHATMLGQGALLATHTRHTAGNPHEDDTTERILIGRGSAESHAFALQTIDFLDKRRFIDGIPSFQVFLGNIRGWIESQDTRKNEKTKRLLGNFQLPAEAPYI